MKARFSTLMVMAVAFLTVCAAANAITMTTAAQVQPFNLTTDPTVVFAIITGEGNPPEITNTNNSTIVNPATLTFNKFDTSLGTLTGVSITFTTTYGATVTLDATNPDAVVGDDDFFADATIGHQLTGSLISTQSLPQTLSATVSADCSPSVPGDCLDSASSTGNSFNGTAGLAAALAEFAGSNTFNLTATLTSALAPRSRDSVDNSTGTLEANWNGSVSVVYTYDNGVAAVPEPLSLYLLATGLGGIALFRRRRR